MPAPARPEDIDPRRLAVVPSAARLGVLGLIAVFVPGVIVFGIARVAGLSTSGAGLIGLLAMMVGMGSFPFYLRRLGRRFES